jgi:hypothetical protein
MSPRLADLSKKKGNKKKPMLITIKVWIHREKCYTKIIIYKEVRACRGFPS